MACVALLLKVRLEALKRWTGARAMQGPRSSVQEVCKCRFVTRRVMHVCIYWVGQPGKQNRTLSNNQSRGCNLGCRATQVITTNLGQRQGIVHALHTLPTEVGGGSAHLGIRAECPKSCGAFEDTFDFLGANPRE